MDKVILYKTDDGDIHQATESEPVDRQELVYQIEAAKRHLHKLQVALSEYDRLADDTAGASPGLQSVDDGDGHVTFIKPVQI